MTRAHSNLNLPESDKHAVAWSDGRSALMQDAERPHRIRSKNQRFRRVLVVSESVLMNAVPAGEMDLAAHRDLKRLTVKPARPNRPTVMVRSVALPDVPDA
jgi:hypothetical protein